MKVDFRQHLPHTRGDEPILHRRYAEGERHLPHTRGDEPSALAAYMGVQIASAPHAWG